MSRRKRRLDLANGFYNVLTGYCRLSLRRTRIGVRRRVVHGGGRKRTQVQELLQTGPCSTATQRSLIKKKLTAHDIEELKKQSRASKHEQQQFTSLTFRPDRSATSWQRLQSSKFFQAGLYTSDDRKWFYRVQLIAPVGCMIAAILMMAAMGIKPLFLVLGGLLGLFTGVGLPQALLERRIKQRQEETM